MSLDEAKRILEDVRTRFNSAFSPADKDTIARLYEAVMGKRFRATTCQRCYHDAVIEITLYLRKNNIMAQEKAYIMKSGFVISCPDFHNGKIFTNENLTDEIAAEYLELYPNRKQFFARVPDKPVKKAQEPLKTDEVIKDTPKAKKPRKTKKTGK